jgi:DNA-binding transcriptional ArsR family regulator
MNYQTPRSDWAVEKVRVFVPAIREKAVLMAIAGYARHDGTGSYVGLPTIAYETGDSVRTVRRHIRSLEKKGLLVTQVGGKHRYHTNRYYIPCCALSLQELEILTGVSGRQLVLPIAHDQARSEVTVSELYQPIGIGKKPVDIDGFLPDSGRTPCPVRPDKMTGQAGQNDRQTLIKPEKEPGLADMVAEKKEKVWVSRPEQLPYLPNGRISQTDGGSEPIGIKNLLDEYVRVNRKKGS